MADFKPTVKKHAINEKKLQLHAQNSVGKSATLKFNIVKNYPRIDVYTNDDNDSKKNEPIRAAMDQPSFYLFLTLLEKAANAKEAFEQTIENRGHTFFGGKRSEKPEVLSRLTVGKDEKGVVFLSVTAKNRPKIKFSILPGNWNTLVNVATGEKVGEAQASHFMTLAWKELLSQMVSTYLVFNYEEEQQQEQKQGGNRWQQGGGRSDSAPSQSSEAAPSFDGDGDNFPF